MNNTMSGITFCGDCPKIVWQWIGDDDTFRIVERYLDTPNDDGEQVCFYVEHMQRDAMNKPKWEPLDIVPPTRSWQFSLLMDLRKCRGEESD